MIFTRGLRVCLAVEPVDFRKSFEGLALVVKGVLKEDERSSKIFAFTNRKRNRVRLLYWDGSGLWLLTKKLEIGFFSWPAAEAGKAKMRLKSEALEMLLSGIDLKGARMRPWYEEPPGPPEPGGGAGGILTRKKEDERRTFSWFTFRFRINHEV